MTYTQRFDGKTALITGGSSGMGLATARRLAAEGASVIITGRDKVKLEAAAETLGDRVHAISGDASNAADLDTLSDAVAARYGQLDVLFANAGIGSFQPIGDVTEAEYHRVLDINFKSVFFTVQGLLPLLQDGSSIVVNAASAGVALHSGPGGAALYTASKAAVHSLTRTLTAEFSPRRIRVNSVSPGYIDTPALRADTPEDIQAVLATLPAAGRIGTADEVAAAVAFLASDDASYINGQDLLVDGGLINAIPGAMV